MNFSLGLLFLLYSFFFAKANEKADVLILDGSVSKDDSIDQKIVGGLPAKVGEFKYQVAVKILTTKGEKFCGGSLLGHQWVLTAAHCLQNGLEFTMYFGGVKLELLEEGVEACVSKKYIKHPKYNAALIRLPCVIKYTPRIQPVRLPLLTHEIHDKVRVTVSGWGRTKTHVTSLSDRLYYVNLTTITNKECAGYYGKRMVGSEVVCAVGILRNNICYGDGGSPLVLYNHNQPTQVGIASFLAQNGCSSGLPSGYVRLSAIREWIKRETGL